MIIGHGMMARAFRAFAEDNEVVVFASGVSNSRGTDVAQFDRESRLLRDALALHKPTIYFGTCSVLDPELRDSAYVAHKLAMEALVAQAGPHHIFRLPQAVGRPSNPHTLANYLHRKIAAGEPFPIWRHARRNLIDVEDVAAIATRLIRAGGKDSLTTIATPCSVPMPELVAIFEKVLGRRARGELVEGGGSYAIEADAALEAAAALGISFDNYVERVIRKYYGAPEPS